jgi:hypothetical protein
MFVENYFISALGSCLCVTTGIKKNFNYNTLRKMYMRAKLPTSDFDSQTAYKHTHAYENHVRLQPVRYGWCWFVLCWWHVCSERKVLLAGGL